MHHNDPLQDSLQVPLTMNLTGTPNIDIDETYIEFPETVVGSSNSYLMNVHNTGTADLEISDVVSTNISFTTNWTALTLGQR